MVHLQNWAGVILDFGIRRLENRLQAGIEGDESSTQTWMAFGLGRVDQYPPFVPFNVLPYEPGCFAGNTKAGIAGKTYQQSPASRRAGIDNLGDFLRRHVSIILIGCRTTLEIDKWRGGDQIHLLCFLEESLGVPDVVLGCRNAQVLLQVKVEVLGFVPGDGIQRAFRAEVLGELGRGLQALLEAAGFEMPLLPIVVLLKERPKLAPCPLVDKSKPCEAFKDLVINGIDPFKELVVHGKSQRLALIELLNLDLDGLACLHADTSQAKSLAFPIRGVEQDPLPSVWIYAQARHDLVRFLRFVLPLEKEVDT